MILKYIQLALRHIWKDKATSLLNIFGLASGIATITLLSFYIYKETSFDAYHDEPENIYRVTLDLKIGNQQSAMAWTSGALATRLRDLAPITDAVRLFRYRSPSVVLKKGTSESFSEENFIWADSNVFNVLKFTFVSGQPATALSRPNTVVISETTSKKYFGNGDPVGKVLYNVTFNSDFEITGVIQDMPETSHFNADMICSLQTLPKLWGDQMLTSWGNNFLYTYIKTVSGTDRKILESKISELVSKNLPPSNEVTYHYTLQPMTSIHLHSKLQNEWRSNSDVAYVYILAFVAVLVLLVSVINYVNLWIARSERRTHEIGVRQAIGGGKNELAFQFFSENIVHGILAFALGVALSGLLLPLVNDILGEDLELAQETRFKIWANTAGAVFLLMALASLYPIQTIIRIKPAIAIKGTVVKLRQGIGLWHGLIGFQMMITTLLITGALLVNRQMNFIQETPVGYDAERLLNITLLSDASQHNYERFKNEVLTNPRVKSASATSHQLGGMLYQSGYVIHNGSEKTEVLWQRIHVDHDFCRTYGIEISAGRDFDKATAADTTNFIVNETATGHLGLRNPADAVGLDVDYGEGLRGKIVGVMKDFHFKTFHSPVEPLVIHIVPERFRMITLNVDQAEFQQTIMWITDKWKNFDPDVPFVYASLGDFNERNYGFERKFGRLIMFFTVIVSILSACGLIGLNLYVVNLRKKEIGIRKVLGAQVSDLLIGLLKRFATITLIAFLLSVPLSWYSLTIWLNSFAYKVNITAGLFIVAGIITAALCLLSVALPSFRAAAYNPVNALKEN
ncbi:MAG TPA: FtsX-like permease family protein [Chryseolinea sp.]|nr:FtsX-like permease family protein [Chryseolinea sp.]